VGEALRKSPSPRRRTQLGTILNAPATRLPQCPLRDAANAEVQRDAVITAAELLTPAGARGISTAERLLQLVEQASAARTAFDEVSAVLLANVPDDDRPTAEALREQGQSLGDGFLSEFTMDIYLTGLRDYLSHLHLLTPPGQPAPVQGLAALAIGGPAAGPGAPVSSIRTTSVSVAIAGTAVTVGAVVVAAIVLMVIAVGSVLAAQYLPNQTFGTLTDYFGLAVAAFGSSSVVGVLALLAGNRPADAHREG
jgi:hypothetical protein